MLHPVARVFLALLLLGCSSEEPREVVQEPTSIQFREMRRLRARARALVGRGDELLVGSEGEILRVVDGEILERLERPAYRGGALFEAGPLVAWPTWSRGDEVREIGESGTRLLDSVADARGVYELREIGERRVLHAYSFENPAEPEELAGGPRLAPPLALSESWVAVVAGSVRVLDRETHDEVALLSTGDRYAVRALAFDGDELLGVDARGTVTRWRLDLPEREQESTPVADPRSLHVAADALVVVGRSSVWVRRGEQTGRFTLDEGQFESSLLLGDTLVLGVRGRPSHLLWLRLE